MFRVFKQPQELVWWLLKCAQSKDLVPENLSWGAIFLSAPKYKKVTASGNLVKIIFNTSTNYQGFGGLTWNRDSVMVRKKILLHLFVLFSRLRCGFSNVPARTVELLLTCTPREIWARVEAAGRLPVPKRQGLNPIETDAGGWVEGQGVRIPR